MIRKVLAIASIFLLGAVFGSVAAPRFGLMAGTVSAQTRKPLTISHIYTGPDGQTVVEEMPVEFTNNGYKLRPVSGAELHRASPGGTADFHTIANRQYVITLVGQAELETSGGKKVSIAPGHIALMEDTTGKGHMMHLAGTEDRVAVFLPLADQSAH